MPRRYSLDPLERFITSTRRAEAGPVMSGVRCLEWTGHVDGDGYQRSSCAGSGRTSDSDFICTDFLSNQREETRG